MYIYIYIYTYRVTCVKTRAEIFVDICKMSQPYKIAPRQYAIAKALGVKIKPSKRLLKKIGIYTPQGQKLFDIGDVRYLDYAQYLKLYGKAYADNRKRLYWQRHKKDTNKGAGYYAARILWS